MYGNKTNKRGFTLLEILIVIALIGIMSAILIPNLERKTARRERELFITQLNQLVHTGWKQALRNHAAYQVTVDTVARRVTVNKETADDALSQDIEQETELIWPKEYEIKELFIEGHQEKNPAKFWFYIMPEGITQDVIINLIDTKDLKDDNPRPFALVLNPFYAHFKTYETFQKP